MPDKNSNYNIIHTKLFRPRLVSDFVPRPRLSKLLKKGEKSRLTLVSGPAGYGKSLLVSNWLETSDRLHCWLSLDEEIDDLEIFLHYLMFGIRKLFSDTCPNTMDLLSSSDQLLPQVLSTELINELLEIKSPFVLVLDDYGLIHNSDIHELLNQLLRFAPSTLQLVLITRRDPPFPLHSLRANGDLVEIRQTDLQFTIPEMSSFLEKSLVLPVDERSLKYMHKQIEGWAAGLRMIAISLSNREDANDFLREMRGDSRHIKDYLMAEVLSRQQPVLRESLLKTSVLNRFCAPLYRVLCHPDCENPCGPDCNGELFMKQLEDSNLFCIPLDSQHEWFRYHHLFQDFLQHTLKRRYESCEIDMLHRRACAWFEEQGLLKDAFHHALKYTDPEVAIQLIVRHRHDLMNKEQWHTLRRWIDLLPRELVDLRPELLMVEAWLHIGWPEMAEIILQIEPLLSALAQNSKETIHLQGEYETLRALLHYHMTEGLEALDCSQKAIQKLPSNYASQRGLAVMLLSMSYQMLGNLKKARSVLFKAINGKGVLNPTYQGRVILTFCFIDYMEADLNGSMQAANQIFELSQKHKLPEIEAHGHYFLGVCSYEQNDLNGARGYLQQAIEKPIINSHNFAFSAFALILTLNAMDKKDHAQEVMASVVNHAMRINNMSLLQLTHAFQAELAIRRGRISEAGIWANSFDPDPFTVAYRFYVPQVTLAKLYLAQNTQEGYNQATDLLSRLHEFSLETHNSRLLVEVLALQALLNDALGNKTAALSIIEQAIVKAEPGNLIRIFLDMGPAMTDLLQQLSEKRIASRFINNLLTAFQVSESGLQPDLSDQQITNSAASKDFSMGVDLTLREVEVLALLADRLSNKEISSKLVISHQTVKRHTINLYKKLNVHNRREAVVRGISLGIIP